MANSEKSKKTAGENNFMTKSQILSIDNQIIFADIVQSE